MFNDQNVTAGWIDAERGWERFVTNALPLRDVGAAVAHHPEIRRNVIAEDVGAVDLRQLVVRANHAADDGVAEIAFGAVVV